MNATEWLKRLVKVANQFRNTPIVDDDFPAYRDHFDGNLQQAERWLYEIKPKVVCLCGSTRFWQEWQDANRRETMAGNIVLTVGSFRRTPRFINSKMIVDGCMGQTDVTVEQVRWVDAKFTDEEKSFLDRLHFHKIDLADEVLVLNVGGYVGESTTREIAYAEQQDKPIRWLEPPTFEVAE